MKTKASFVLASLVFLLACATPPPSAAPLDLDRRLSEAILQANGVTRFLQRVQRRVDPRSAENQMAFGCLEVGRLSGLIEQLVAAVSREGETFQDQRNDPARDSVFSAHERMTALTGLCGEQSGERVAGYRYMPKLKLASERDPKALELAQGIVADLSRFRSESPKGR